jgi:hypothetical protein
MLFIELIVINVMLVRQVELPVGVQISEHKKCVSKGDANGSAVAEHCVKCDHNIDWGSVRVLAQDTFVVLQKSLLTFGESVIA